MHVSNFLALFVTIDSLTLHLVLAHMHCICHGAFLKRINLIENDTPNRNEEAIMLDILSFDFL